MTRPIRFIEARRGLRNKGLGWFASTFVAAVWVVFGVEVEEEST